MSAPSLTRGQALSARPVRMPVVARAEAPGGSLRLTVELMRPRWQAALGASRTFERAYELDEVGRAVYEACDGSRSVQAIARHFARERHVSIPEAEMAVAAYLKTLVEKGLVGMKAPRGGGS